MKPSSLLPWALAALSAGCTTDDFDTDLVYQGGDLTIFEATTAAFDTPSDFLASDPVGLARFLAGDVLYDRPRVASPASIPGTGGLGPLYVGKACSTCHLGAGRTKSTLFTHGGTGFDFSTFLVFLRSKNGQQFREYGRVLHDHAILPAVPEGKLRVEYTETCDRFPTEDQEAYCLIRPRYWIEDWYATPIPEEDLVMTVRTPLRHVGLGLMMALDRDELRALAAISYPEYGISGKLQWIEERGQKQIGLSGHKAQHADLTIELGFSSDLGVTSHRYPEEVAEGQAQMTQDFGVEISDADMAQVDSYLHTLGVPARRHVNDPRVRRGQEMFYAAKCHLCHTPTLHTGPEAPKLIDGTPLPQLARQTVHPYSDFLLHDLGPDLGDDFGQGVATGDEWRTAPLWGIGLQETVNGHTHFLHDGRARNYVEAILWHKDEEGRVSTEIFRHMPKSDRDALVTFLRSL